MAMIFQDPACAICGVVISRESAIHLPSLDASERWSELSAAVVHLACISSHPAHAMFQARFLAVLGADGEKPSGRRAFTVSPRCRGTWAPGFQALRLSFGPMYLTTEAPLVRWTDAVERLCSLDEPGRVAFEDAGLAIAVQRSDMVVRSVRTTGSAILPSEASPASVLTQERMVQAAVYEYWPRDASAAIELLRRRGL